MLSDKPEVMYQEVQGAIRLRRMHTAKSQEMVEIYAGANFREGWACREGDINHPYEVITNQIPSLVYNNPRVKVKSRRPRVQRELVQAMQHGLNRWTADVDLSETLELAGYDMFFGFGVILTTLEPLPGYSGKQRPPMRPGVRRISPRRFFQDPIGGIGGPRFRGHIVVKDRQDLLDAVGPDGKPMYDRKLVEDLATDSFGENNQSEMEALRHDLGVRREQVLFYEVWVPERGMIYTLTEQALKGNDGKAAFLRKPRKAFCPPWGPYTVFGMYPVPDEVYPLAPLIATANQVNELNDHRAQIRQQADLAKKMILVDGKNQTLVNSIITYANGTIVAMDNFDPNGFAEVEIMGPSKEALEYVEYMKGELDQTSGLTQTKRGNVTGATATEVAEASSGTDARLRYMQKRFRKAAAQVLRSAGWFMFNAETVVYPVPGRQADEKLGQFQGSEDEMSDKLFLGGVQPGQEDFTFDDLELEIEPYSMEMVDQNVLQTRMQQVFQVMTAALPLMVQFPFANWPQILDDLFESMNIPDGRKYIDWEKLEQMLQQQFTPGQPQQIPGLDGAAPVDLAGLKGAPSMPPGGPQSGQPGPQQSNPGGRVVDISAMLRQAVGNQAA